MLAEEAAERLRVGKVCAVERYRQGYGSEVGECPEVAVKPRKFEVLRARAGLDGKGP